MLATTDSIRADLHEAGVLIAQGAAQRLHRRRRAVELAVGGPGVPAAADGHRRLREMHRGHSDSLDCIRRQFSGDSPDAQAAMERGLRSLCTVQHNGACFLRRARCRSASVVALGRASCSRCVCADSPPEHARAQVSCISDGPGARLGARLQLGCELPPAAGQHAHGGEVLVSQLHHRVALQRAQLRRRQGLRGHPIAWQLGFRV